MEFPGIERVLREGGNPDQNELALRCLNHPWQTADTGAPT